MKPTDQNWYVLDNTITGAWNNAPGKKQFVATRPNWKEIYEDKDGRVICEIRAFVSSESEYKVDVARLIAAAPEMLKALKMLREKLFADEFYDGKAIQDTLDQVICNATGGGQL